MKFLILLPVFLFLFFSGAAQNQSDSFLIQTELKHTPVISQGSTGTCWSFATTSFLESEMMRKGFPETDLSEMYFVYHAYLNKAFRYLLFDGNNNFTEGGQAHDVFDVIRKNGFVPLSDYPGQKVDGRFNHRELVNELNMEVTRLNKLSEKFNAGDMDSLNPILKKHIGKIPKKINAGNKTIAPTEFFSSFGIDPDDYIELTSFSHHPFYQPFVLEVPDNWSHGCYYNLPVDELLEVMFYSLAEGYTFCWDGDTSEKTFSHKNGKADLPKNQIGKVDQKMRQETFLERTTTDDHLMHIVGLSKDEEERTCFYTKNSWGPESNNFGGYLHMTEDYVRLKTIAILVHKNAIPKAIKEKLKL